VQNGFEKYHPICSKAAANQSAIFPSWPSCLQALSNLDVVSSRKFHLASFCCTEDKANRDRKVTRKNGRKNRRNRANDRVNNVGAVPTPSSAVEFMDKNGTSMVNQSCSDTFEGARPGAASDTCSKEMPAGVSSYVCNSRS